MRGVILAAGIGKRLRPLTNHIPKVLLSVGGKSILEHQLDALHLAGFKEVVIIIGFNKETVMKTAGNEYKGMKIIYRINNEYDTTNNLRSLWCARDTLNVPFVQIHGDLILNSKILYTVISSSVESAVIIDNDSAHFVEDANRVRSENGRIIEINKVISFNDCDGKAIGIYKFSQLAAMEYIKNLEESKENTRDGFEVALRPTLKKIPFGIIDVTGLPYAEIDDLNDFRDAELRINDIVK
ncbi:MAG: phosphocholine cytidylyltransferase family protein [Nanoarchaeota archaeon]